MSRLVSRMIRNASFGLSAEKQLLGDLIWPSRNKNLADGDPNITIVGGELSNKGAQAMTFTVVDQLRRRYPDKNICVFSRVDVGQDEKDKYNFDIFPWGPEIQLPLLSPVMSAFNTNDYPNKVSAINIIKNSAMMVDINGYALTSQFGIDTSVIYLMNIAIAKKFNIPLYILPQSIGPFEYSPVRKAILEPMLRTYLKYPEIICAREPDGVKWLSNYTQENISNEHDIVLQNKEYNINNIFGNEYVGSESIIPDNSVGIVPNSQVFNRNSEEKLYDIYECSISKLLAMGKNVHVLRHSREDSDICEKIKGIFPDSDQVILHNEDYNAIELENIISNFDFIIGSRYHSIVHSYKNGVPAIAIGWAIKYRDLLSDFQQSKYFFDGRNEIKKDEICVKIEQMCRNHLAESDKISNITSEVQESNIFGMLFEDE